MATSRPLLSRAIERTQRLLGRSRRATLFALRARRFLNGVVTQRLGHDIDPDRNGEHWLLDEVAPTCRTFVDVGANVGAWSEAFLARAPDAQGIAVEPGVAAANRLRALGRGEQLRIFEAAAGAEPGTATLFEEADAGTRSSLYAAATSRSVVPREVPVVALDQLVEDAGWPSVDFVKIDAEGHDLHVLRGAQGLLRDGRVGMLQFEYNAPWRDAGCTLGAAAELLEDRGYALRLLKGRGLWRFPRDVYGEFYHYANFVAVSPGNLERFGHLEAGQI